MNRTEEYIYYNALFDIYGNLLNERESEIYRLFYEEDLSLQEIADNRSVSKSAIGSAIKTINEKLENYESILHFLKKKKEIKKIIEEIENEKVKEKIQKILDK